MANPLLSDPSYIASGFCEDCSKLLELFRNEDNIRYENFCQAWQKMKFSLIFM